MSLEMDLRTYSKWKKNIYLWKSATWLKTNSESLWCLNRHSLLPSPFPHPPLISLHLPFSETETRTIDNCSPDTGPPVPTDTSQRAVFPGRLSCLQYWSYIPGECSPEMAVPPSTQTPFMKEALPWVPLHWEYFRPSSPLLWLVKWWFHLGKSEFREDQKLLPSSHLQLSS